MAGPILKDCCFCGSLRNGSIIWGILGIISAILTIVIMFVTRVEFKTIVLDWLPQNAVKIILVINLVMTILIKILMIVGVVKRNHYLMLPWVALGIPLALGLLVSVIYTAVTFFIAKFYIDGALWLLFGVLSVALYVYMWLVVYSFFEIIREEGNRGRYSKQPYRR